MNGGGALEARIEAPLEAHPLSKVLTSIPGIGTAATLTLQNLILARGQCLPHGAPLTSTHRHEEGCSLPGRTASCACWDSVAGVARPALLGVIWPSGRVPAAVSA